MARLRLAGVVRGADPQLTNTAGQAGLIPLVVEPDLVFSLAVLEGSEADKQQGDSFLTRYRSLDLAGGGGGLVVVSGQDVRRTAASLLSCLGCRKAVETLHSLMASNQIKLGRLNIASSGEVSLAREDWAETRLASILSTEAGGRTKGRCSLHSLHTKKAVSSINWLHTWHCMEDNCRQEICLLPFHEVKKTLESFLKRHRFCSDCTFSVNQAYSSLQSQGRMTFCPQTGCPGCTGCLVKERSKLRELFPFVLPLECLQAQRYLNVRTTDI